MKVGLQITARLKSSRLPFKLLKDLNGCSIIEHVIQRAKKVNGSDNIVLCTSTNPQDRPLVDAALSQGIYYYLGSEEDVLQRLLDAAIFFGFDYILNITGENPLFSIDYANQLVDLLRKDACDFAYIDGLPIGCAVYGLKVKALKLVCEVKKEIDTEIWGPLINRPELFKIGTLAVHDFFRRPGLRLTNDYFEDFQLMQSIFSHFPSATQPSLYHALKVLDSHPEYLKINDERVQAGLAPETLARINSYFIKHHNEIIERKNKIYHDF